MSQPNRILIVEDETIIALDLSETLTSLGYTVIAAVPSGEAAIELCRKEQPDMILMDIRLQGALTGIEAADILYRTHNIPSVVLTAFSDEKSRKMLNPGVFGYLVKPYDEDELDGTIATALHRSKELQAIKASISPSFASGQGNAAACTADDSLRIRSLGFPLTVTLNGQTLTSEKMSRNQRELLGLLLSSPSGMIDREELETDLWPESSQEHARAALDTTISRFRALLKNELATSGATSYLAVRKGVLTLENFTLDLTHFQELAGKGREAKKSDNLAEATRNLEEASELWRGEFLSGVARHDRVLEVRRHSTRAFLDICLMLGAIYRQQQRFAASMAILQRGLAVEGTSQPLTAAIYVLLRQRGQCGEGQKLLLQYEKALQQDGLTRQEIGESLRWIQLQWLVAQQGHPL